MRRFIPWLCASLPRVIAITVVGLVLSLPGAALRAWSAEAPMPLLQAGKPVDWWFVFKFGSAAPFAGCGPNSGTRTCEFGGKVQTYKIGQQYVYASSLNGTLIKGSVCVGTTEVDPIGATFGQVYNGSFNYLIWNDQFYGDPALKICGKADGCGAPWGHSKGMAAWNEDGDGFVMQVTTPSWPGSGSKKIGRKSGNTLGCVKTNNVRYSQHFFALKLTKDDLVKLLKALANASVVTDPNKLQIVHNGGPADVQQLVDSLGKKSSSVNYQKIELSTGVTLISKPSRLEVPPWQMVSSLLKGEDILAATWWANPRIYSTTRSEKIRCWDNSLTKPGKVAIATSGNWDDNEIGLKGGQNHAKIGVTISGENHYVILGDENQQGTIVPPKCNSSQNGRGGIFFALENKDLFESLSNLLEGGTAPTGEKKPN